MGADCNAGVCTGEICQPASCSDGVRNGDETALDCGGPTCAACSTGLACSQASDCASHVCDQGSCAAPSCSDGVENGDETGQDCGGPTCAACGDGSACQGSADCSSGICDSGTCVPAPTCTDGVQNGDETGQDCGGPTCPACGVGLGCAGNGDCLTGLCLSGVCATPSCTDGVQDGSETARDCGGASCPACADGAACVSGTDCLSGICSGHVCAAPSCHDGVKNQDETDTDCGGSVCGPCVDTQACLVDADCVNLCEGTTCRSAVSCEELHTRKPALGDGAYTLKPDGVSSRFGAYCDMTRGGGGWTLLLKADGTTTLAYDATYWTDTTLLNDTDLSLANGSAKYAAFVSLPVTTLRGELDGTLFTQDFANPTTPQQIFSGASVTATGTFPMSGGNWSYQPNCQTFGVNTPYAYNKVRFGWVANQESNCNTCDTGIGLGHLTTNNQTNTRRGAGYECLSTNCNHGNVNAAGNGRLWGR